MDPKLLDFFVRVAELKSINRAAHTLNVSQPSLSRYISTLEKDIGTELFVRGQRGVALTVAGSVLLERVRPILRQISALHEELGRATAEQVVLGMPASLRSLMTGHVTAALAASHPHLQLRVYEGLSNAIKGWMQNGLVDVGMVAFESEYIPPFIQTPLVREPLLLVGGRNTDLNPDKPVQLVELGALKFILPGRPNLLRHVAETAMRRRGLAFQSAVEAESLGLCLDLVERGVGHSVMPYSAVHAASGKDAFRWAPILGLSVTWALAVNEGREESVGVQVAAQTLEQRAREVVRSGDWLGAEIVVSR
jgi:LysR family nitrogen assimilation transcriptional regulator